MKNQITAGLTHRISSQLSNSELNALYNTAWKDDAWRDFEPVLKRSLAFICGYQESLLMDSNLARNGGLRAFILDLLVHPQQFRRRGIGQELIRRAAKAKRDRVEWLHVDFEPSLKIFCDGCGFRKTAAGLINLKN